MSCIDKLQFLEFVMSSIMLKGRCNWNFFVIYDGQQKIFWTLNVNKMLRGTLNHRWTRPQSSELYWIVVFNLNHRKSIRSEIKFLTKKTRVHCQVAFYCIINNVQKTFRPSISLKIEVKIDRLFIVIVIIFSVKCDISYFDYTQKIVFLV